MRNRFALQSVKERNPEFRAVEIRAPDPERIAVALEGDADGETAGAIVG
jgi:hypothetical protein